MYNICFICVYKFHSFSGPTTFVSFESTGFVVFLDLRHLFHLSLQVSWFFWTYGICLIWVYKFHLFFWTYDIHFIWVYKVHSFSGPTTFVSFESTSFVVFLDLRHLFHLSLQVSWFFSTYDIWFIWVYKFRDFFGPTTLVSFESISFVFFWTYDICFIWVYKFHRFSWRTTLVSFESINFIVFSGRTIFVSFESTSFIVLLDVRHLFHLSLQVSSDPFISAPFNIKTMTAQHTQAFIQSIRI
jgi:hypothetical protein